MARFARYAGDDPIARLAAALSSDEEAVSPGLLDLMREINAEFSEGLPNAGREMWNRWLSTLIMAAEELGPSATPFEIAAKAREIRAGVH